MNVANAVAKERNNMSRGYWKLTIEMFADVEPDEYTLQHIGEMITDGCTEGEISQDGEEEEEISCQE
jgi:hypothetical protein